VVGGSQIRLRRDAGGGAPTQDVIGAPPYARLLPDLVFGGGPLRA
jgi:hypothetical protein